MFTYLIFEMISALVGALAVLSIFIYLIKKPAVWNVVKQKGIYVPIILFVIAFFAGLISNRTYAPDFAMPAFMHSDAPGGVPPSIPFSKILDFLIHKNNFEKVADISASPDSVPSEAQKPDADGIVRIHLKAQEVISEIAPGIYLNYWTYNKQVPGPMLRVREGDTMEITLENDKSSLHHHNIDLHAVTGQGGGAMLSDVAPGETKTFKWKALNSGLYVYHCAMPNVSTHNSHGQYGLIMVDPKDSQIALDKVDKEFYIMQGEFYTAGQIGKLGLVPFDSDALLAGNPNYVVFNGKIESVPRLQAKVGDKIRIYVGNGGVNLISSFHIIGEIFDKVYPEAAIGTGSAILKNVQTTEVLPGGASIVEFTVNVPGKYLLVDHALARMNKGAWATLEVSGDKNPDIFSQINNNNKEINMKMN
ncbi:MAG: multicopper oxidase domain-containing protein [Patescibacteria group bacterium]